MFIALLKYVQPIKEVERLLDEHVNFLDHYYSQQKFIVSGRQNPRSGGVILINAGSRAEVEQMIREDPFHKNGIAEYEIVEFEPTKYDPRFADFARYCL